MVSPNIVFYVQLMSLFVGSFTVRANLWSNLKSDAERSHGHGHPHSHSRFSVSCLSESLFPTILVAPAHLQAAQLLSLFLFYATCSPVSVTLPTKWWAAVTLVAGCSDFGGRPDQTGPPGVEQVGWGTRGQQATIHLLSELGRAPLFSLGQGGALFERFG